ncbi:MAG: metallophosphoesterase [Massilia sp.]|nr:metallophosphoesterase [Massilia sp.]
MQDNPERFIAIQNNQGRDVFTSMILVPDEVAIPAPTTGPFRAAPTPDQTYQHSSGMQAVLDAEATMGEENTRDLLYRFWNLSSSQRRDIATSLGLLKDGEMKLPEPERYGRALIRAVELQIMDKIAAEVAKLEV